MADLQKTSHVFGQVEETQSDPKQKTSFVFGQVEETQSDPKQKASFIFGQVEYSDEVQISTYDSLVVTENCSLSGLPVLLQINVATICAVDDSPPVIEVEAFIEEPPNEEDVVGNNLRYVIPASKLRQSGNQVRILLAYRSTVWEALSVFIGHQAASGDVYDFDGNQKRVTFGGQNGVVVTYHGQPSDWILFDLDKTKNLVLSFFFGSDQTVPISASGSVYDCYTKGGTSEAGDTNVTGYTPVTNRTNSRIISKILIASSGVNAGLVIGVYSGTVVVTEFVNINFGGVIVGSVCWGHDTDVEEDNVEDFADWSGTGAAEGTGDEEVLVLSGEQYMDSPDVQISGWTTLAWNKYRSGAEGTLKYKTANTQLGLDSAEWIDYTDQFNSLGWVRLRMEE